MRGAQYVHPVGAGGTVGPGRALTCGRGRAGRARGAVLDLDTAVTGTARVTAASAISKPGPGDADPPPAFAAAARTPAASTTAAYSASDRARRGEATAHRAACATRLVPAVLLAMKHGILTDISG